MVEMYHNDVIWCFICERRPRRDLLMVRHRYVPLRSLGGVRLRRLWVFPTGCFIWGLFETLWRRTDGTLSFCPLDTLSRTLSRRCHVETYHWDGLATFYWDIVGCFIWDVPATSLGRTERSRYDVAMTSCCRMVGIKYKYYKCFLVYMNFKNDLIEYIHLLCNENYPK